MKLTISRVLSLIAIPCLLYLTYIAGNWGLADIYVSSSITVLDKWRYEKKYLTVTTGINYVRIYPMHSNMPQIIQISINIWRWH